MFSITASGKLTTLHSFDGTDGANPFAPLVQSTNGTFYGTTSAGGANGQGTVFSITSNGNLTTLHSFAGYPTDGAYPYAGLAQGTNGNFYGTTHDQGGDNSVHNGTVFKITPSGTLTTLGKNILDTREQITYIFDMKILRTLQEAIIYFSDPQRAFDYAVALRWPDGKVTCPRCDSDRNCFIKTRRLWLCYGCQRQFTVKVKSVFEDSPISLDKWMMVAWMLSNCKNGVSSYEIAKAIGVTQKSAWFMLQRLRLAMQDDFFGKKLGSGPNSEVEVDETFIGGKARNMHKGRKGRLTGRIDDDKAVVVGFMERGGKARTQIVTKRRKHNLQPLVREQVQAGAALYTDALMAYTGLNSDYKHRVVDHAVEYVHGRVHTNTLENFWSLVKRGLHGTYVSVEPFHLFRYLDEQMFRFNNRKGLNDGQRFALAMNGAAGKRLTYAQLTGKGTDSLHHETTGAGETEVPF